MTSSRQFALDASAVLALLQNEPGHETVREVIARSWIHSVNAAEVISKLARSGAPKGIAAMAMRELRLNIREEFTIEQAETCGSLLAETRREGLSLGDCVCLTAGAWDGSEVVTADRRWKKLEGRSIHGFGLKIWVIR